MPLFPRKKKCEITYLDQYIVVIGKDKYLRHDHEFATIKRQLNSIIYKLNKMANEIEDLTAEVQETKGIMSSAKTLIEGFAAALAAAGTNPAKLKALRDDLNAGSEELATALAANPLPGEVIEPPVEPPVEPEG